MSENPSLKCELTHADITPYHMCNITVYQETDEKKYKQFLRLVEC